MLGTHSLIRAGAKVGSQHIAEKLAQQGHEVTYATSQASALTLLFPAHRQKYLNSFRDARVADNLVQVTPVNLFPARLLKRVEGSLLERPLAAANRRAERTRGRALEGQDFDVCIFSAAASMTLVRKIRARHYVYRHNDVLAEFPAAPRSLVAFEEELLRSHPITAVFSVNEKLAEYARAYNARLPVSVVPNGIDRSLFEDAEPDPLLLRTRERNVLYAGAFNVWVDVDLVLETARLLPDHLFHLFGGWEVPPPASLPRNVTVYGSIRHEDVPAKMKACAVGLIPYGLRNATRMVDRPLKYYEYLAAGAGVAATSHAGSGMAPYAALGDSPEQFAKAILAAPSLRTTSGEAIRAELRGLDWHDLVRRMIACCDSRGA